MNYVSQEEGSRGYTVQRDKAWMASECVQTYGLQVTLPGYFLITLLPEAVVSIKDAALDLSRFEAN